MPKKKPEKPLDLNTEILRQIRDNTAKTNERVDALAGRVDTLTDRVTLMHGELLLAIGETNDRVDTLHTRVVRTDMRLSSQHAEILGALELLREQLVSNAARDEVVNDLVGRVSTLEKKQAV